MWNLTGRCYVKAVAGLLQAGYAFGLFLILACPALADELWVPPQKASQQKKVGNWALANLGGETHFSFAIPDNFGLFTKGVVVLIPPETGVLTYALSISVAKEGDTHDTYNYSIGELSAPVTANKLTEIDVSVIFAGSVLTPGQTYVSLNFRSTSTQVLGLRFHYEPNAEITIAAGPGLVGGGAVGVGGSIALGLATPVPIAFGGTGSTVQNFVDLESAQSISGMKQFTSGVSATTLCIAGDCRTSWPASAPDNLGNHTATQNLNMNGFLIGNVNAVNANNMSVANAMSVAGPAAILGSMSVGGSTTVGNTLSVVGATVFSNIMNVAGRATFNSAADVLGATSLGSSLAVSGPALFHSTLSAAGNTSLGGALSVTGSAAFQGNMLVAGSVNAASFNTVSDERAKKDIEELSEQDMRVMLDRIVRARVVRFRFQDETSELDPTRPEKHRPVPHIGVTAQSMPEEVVEGGQILRLKMGDMIGYLIATLRGLRAESLELAARQEARIRELEEHVAKLERIARR